MRQTSDFPLMREVVLIGGGHTHALVLRNWAMRPVPGARLSVINPGPTAPYTGMLPGHVAGHYDHDALQIDLVKLARFAGARLILGRATDLDLPAGLVEVSGRGPVAFDHLSIDIGVTSDMPSLPGFAEHGVPAKPLDVFARRWAAFCAGSGPAHLAVIGGGVAGAELAMAAAYRLRSLDREGQISLLERGQILSGLPRGVGARLRRALAQNGVEVLEGVSVAKVTADHVALADGTRIPSAFCLGAAGARPQDWLRQTGLDLTKGYITVDAELRSITDPRVFAVGDCAHLSHAPRPKAGVYAVRAAPILAHNLRADLQGRSRRAFRPQRDFLKLITMGRKSALAEKAGFSLAGPALWRWKDRIDQSFMAQFRDLAPMAAPAAPAGAVSGLKEVLGVQPPCAACGAKLGRDALSTALAGLPSIREDVLNGPGDDAAILRVGNTKQVITTDHLRAFCEDPVLLTRAAANHAMGDIWAMGAEPQAALASVIVPRMTPDMQVRWLSEIMTEAGATFAKHGVDIVGGHSSMGAELSIGFTLTGLLEGPAIGLDGAKQGDALILTRGIGTGVIMAAEMVLAARGGDVAACWAQMSRPQGDAAHILRAHAHAMTDVTGFGLAGHLIAICEASGLAASVELDKIPVLDGAIDLAAQGTRSSLFDGNRAALAGRLHGMQGPRADLVFDPQTSGGLLAAVPDSQAAALVTTLRELGHDAAQIGHLAKGAPGIDLI